MLDLTSEGRLAQIATLTVGAEISEPGVTTTTLTGPITCIAQFGNGSALSTVEFDVPSASQTPSSQIARQFRSRLRSGASVSLPAGCLKVYFRNDSCLLPCYPGDNGVEPICIGPADGIGADDPTCYAHAAYGNTYGGNGRLRRTYIIANNNSWSPSVLAPPAIYQATVGIPPFAKKVSIMRNALDTSTVYVTFSNSGLNVGQPGPFVLAPNDIGPIEIPALCDKLLVFYTGGPINVASAVFDLEV